MTDQAESLEAAIRDAALRMAEAAGPAAAREALLKTADRLLIDYLKWEPHPENANSVRAGHNVGYDIQFHTEVEYDPQTGLHYWILLHEGIAIERSEDYESPEQAKSEALEALKQTIQLQI